MQNRNNRTLRFIPDLAPLEDRAVPAVTVREATGVDIASITGARDQFRADLGGGTTAAANGSFGGLRREINWDGTPDAKSSPNNLPFDFFNTTSPRGAIFSTPGTAVRVSGDDSLPAGDELFGDINDSYATDLGDFTPQRIFTAIGSNVVEVVFRVPGTSTPAVVQGFGAVFSDVDLNTSTKIEFFDVNGKSIFSREALATNGTATFSFLGASFAAGDPERIARVRITSGNAALAAGVEDITNNGASDIVAMDDFLYSEPKAAPLPFAVGNGAGNNVQVRNPDGSLRSQFAAFADGFTGGVRVASADFNGDGTLDTVVGTGPGIATQVRVLSGLDNKTVLFTIDPFESSFTGGVYVAAGDITGDGVPDLIITPDQGGGPRARVFSGKDFSQVADFFGINDPNFRGGARSAVGNMNGTGPKDLIVVAGFGGGPRIAVFDGAKVTAEGNVPSAQTLSQYETWKIYGDFAVFEDTLRNGVFVTAGDFNGDAVDDFVFGGGPGGGPRVQIVSGKDLATSNGKTQTSLANFFAGTDSNRGGVRVSAANLDFDGTADLVVGAGTGDGSTFTGFLGSKIASSGTPPTAFASSAFTGVTAGVFVG